MPTSAKTLLRKAVASGGEILRRETVGLERATELLEMNGENRPLSQAHVERIASQILQGKWRYNGDTIKISKTGDVLDGQHRLWAIIETKIAVDTAIAWGIDRDAFATIDTIRKARSFGDTVALNGAPRYRNVIGSALAWLIRWQRGVVEQYKAPVNRVENSDIERAFADNPGITLAVEKATQLRTVANPSILAFLYYLAVSRNESLAERFFSTLSDPAGIGVNDPFFRLRAYFTSEHHKRKDALMTIALAIKAMNAANTGTKMQNLAWRQQGRAPEPFPKLEI